MKEQNPTIASSGRRHFMMGVGAASATPILSMLAPADGRRLFLDPDARLVLPELRLEDELPLAAVLAVGPEGGWSPGDRDALSAAGFEGLRLGPRVLRTETAGLAAMAALQSRWGDLA